MPAKSLVYAKESSVYKQVVAHYKMEIKEPEFRCGGNWQDLADLFGYEIGEDDQDWTYTIV